MTKHPGIRLHNIPARGGPGLLFAAGVLTIFLVEIPTARLVLAAGVAGGLAVAGLLRWAERAGLRRRSIEQVVVLR